METDSGPMLPVPGRDPHQGDGSMSTWTVMVYMGADNLPTEKDLSQAARADLAEMQRVGSNDQLTVLVQIDDKTVGMPRRYRVLKDSLELHRFEGDCKQIDMASPE